MVPRRHRLHDSRRFSTTVRHGARATRGRVVGYLDRTDVTGPARVGLIVSRQVGNAVERHRVSRLLRHAAGAHLASLPEGTVLVLRALPGAAARDRRLADDVRDLVARLAPVP